MKPGEAAGIDHLVFAAPDLAAAMEQVEELLGSRPEPGGRHPDWGTHNAILPLGRAVYLEVIAPDPEAAVQAEIFGLDRVTEPRLVTWAAKVTDIEARRVAAAGRGAKLGEILAGSRETPEGSVLRWRLTDPAAVLGDGLVPFLIDWGSSPHPAADRESPCRFLGLRGEHPEPGRIRELLDAVGVEIPVGRGADPRLIASMETPAGEVELT